MVNLTAPLLSQEASGTIARVLTYARTPRGTIAGARGDRRDARSPAQLARRAFITFLTKQWQGINQANQQTWAAIGRANNTSAYHAYLKINAANWHNFKAPGKIWPIERSDNPGRVLVTDAEWIEHRIKLTVKASRLRNNWGLIIFASKTSGFTLQVDNAIMLQKQDDSTTRYWYWTPPAVDTWYINSYAFSEKGKLSTSTIETSAVP